MHSASEGISGCGGGEYLLQNGFGWTNGLTRKLMALYPADAVADQCPLPKHAAQ